jgi:hypothetical protein
MYLWSTKIVVHVYLSHVHMTHLSVYYPCCRLDSWVDNLPCQMIVHGLAGPVLYPLSTSWPAVGYNSMLGLCDTINPVLGLHGGWDDYKSLNVKLR